MEIDEEDWINLEDTEFLKEFEGMNKIVNAVRIGQHTKITELHQVLQEKNPTIKKHKVVEIAIFLGKQKTILEHFKKVILQDYREAEQFLKAVELECPEILKRYRAMLFKITNSLIENQQAHKICEEVIFPENVYGLKALQSKKCPYCEDGNSNTL